LLAGNYTLTTTDAIGNTHTNLITITNEDSLELLNQTLAPAAASITIGGGTQPYSYLWMPGGFTTSAISSVAAGTYTYFVTDGGGCNLIGTVIIVAGLGLNDHDKHFVEAFPNPATNTITVKSDEDLQTVELLDVSGKVLMSRSNIAAKATALDVKNLSNGAYFVKVSNTSSIKIVIAR
jgi:hypothetical protein